MKVCDHPEILLIDLSLKQKRGRKFVKIWLMELD